MALGWLMVGASNCNTRDPPPGNFYHRCVHGDSRGRPGACCTRLEFLRAGRIVVDSPIGELFLFEYIHKCAVYWGICYTFFVGADMSRLVQTRPQSRQSTKQHVDFLECASGALSIRLIFRHVRISFCRKISARIQRVAAARGYIAADQRSRSMMAQWMTERVKG